MKSLRLNEEIKKIESVVSNNIGIDHSVYGNVEFIKGVLGVRKINIVLKHERNVLNKEKEIVEIKDILINMAKKIIDTLKDRGCSVSCENDINLFIECGLVSASFKTNFIQDDKNIQESSSEKKDDLEDIALSIGTPDTQIAEPLNQGSNLNLGRI